MLVQEHWLWQEQLASDFARNLPGTIVHGISAMDPGTLLLGRPFGGCAIVYKRDWTAKVQPVSLLTKRACGVRIEMSNFSLMLFTVYMPCDTGSDRDNLQEFDLILREIMSSCVMYPSCPIVIGGDFSTSFGRAHSLHRDCLNAFMREYNLQCGLRHPSSNVDFTFESKIDGTRSILDHFLLSDEMIECVTHYSPHHCIDNFSDHTPLFMELSIPIADYRPNRATERTITDWNTASIADIALYRAQLDVRLNAIAESDGLRNIAECRSFSCQVHCDVLGRLFQSVTSACLDSSSHMLTTKSADRKRKVPNWNARVQELKDKALLWHRIWKDNGCPTHGLLFDIRKSTRKKYHSEIRKLEKDEAKIQASKMADALHNNTHRDLWTEVRKVKASRNLQQVRVVDDRTDADICALFADKYQALYNSVPYTHDEINSLKNQTTANINEKCEQGECYSEHTVSADNVKRAIQKLKRGKRDGATGLSTDHLKAAPPIVASILAVLFSSTIQHEVVPEDMLLSTLVPIPKGQKSPTSSENYRAIALSSILGKILDNIIIDQQRMFLESSDLQFAYKRAHSTVLCNFVLQEVVHHYNSQGSVVYNLSLDATKAFDRVHIPKLFSLVSKKGVCPLLVRFLLRMYVGQRIRVQWGEDISDEHDIVNGVKQGGVLSPILFTIYLDELLARLEHDGNAGCQMGDAYAGVVAYADDVCLLSPTIFGLKQMLCTTESFADEFHLQFNPSKSLLVVHGPNPPQLPKLAFMGKLIPAESSAKHLGMRIGEQANEHNIQALISDLFGRTNCLKSMFAHVDWELRLHLFRSYCKHLYGCESWNLDSKKVKAFYVAYRKSKRYILNLPYRTHKHILYEICKESPIEYQVANRISKFIFSVTNSSNRLVASCALQMLNGSRSNLSNSLSVISHTFKRPRNSFSVTYLPYSQHIDRSTNTNIVIDLLNMMNNLPQGFTLDDIQCMLNIIATN